MEHQDIEHAVTLAVKKTFAILGVDIDRPESVEMFREDLRFSRKLRRLADHALIGMVGVIALAVVTALWTGMVQLAKGR